MDQADAWRAAGLYDPDGPGAADRLALLEYLTEHGATVEQMVVAHGAGTLPGVASDLVTQGRTDMVTVAELADRGGVSTSPRLARPVGRRHPGRGRDAGPS